MATGSSVAVRAGSEDNSVQGDLVSNQTEDGHGWVSVWAQTPGPRAFLGNGSVAVYGEGGAGYHAGYFEGDVNIEGGLEADNITLTSNCADGQVLKWSGGVGTCGTDVQGAGGAISGEGATGRVAIWNGTSTVNSSSDLVWDNTNSRLGIGESSPSVALHIAKTFGDGGLASFGGTGANANTVTGDFSVAIGRQSEASGIYSFAVGNIATANSSSSIALGADTVAGAQGAFAGGYNSQALGQYSVALGHNSVARGNQAIALGYNSDAEGTASTTIGFDTNASGGYSFAGGFQSNASGTRSFAFGQAAAATNSYSVVFGEDMRVTGSNSFGIALNDQNGATLSQANTMAVMGGSVGIGTLAPTSTLSVGGTGLPLTGIYGEGTLFGVIGNGSSYGVLGYDSDDQDVWGALASSTSHSGVYGQGDPGVQGKNTNFTGHIGELGGENFGAHGRLETTEYTAGYIAYNNSGRFYGAYGTSTLSGEDNIGVYGEANSGSSNIGVIGNASTSGGSIPAGKDIGVYGTGDDLAAFFDGHVNVTGNLTVGTGTVFIDGTNSRVGIGTKNPTSLLELVESAAGPGQNASDALNLTGGDGGGVTGGIGGDGGGVILGGGAGGGTTSAVNGDDGGAGGSLRFIGGDGGDVSGMMASGIYGGKGGDIVISGGTGGDAGGAMGATAGDGGDIILDTGDAGSGTFPGSDGDVIVAQDNYGQLGVGMVPISRLSVNGSARVHKGGSTALLLDDKDVSEGSYSGLRWQAENSAGSSMYFGSIRHNYRNKSSVNERSYLTFHVARYTEGEAMRLTEERDLGVGTYGDPEAALHVVSSGYEPAMIVGSDDASATGDSAIAMGAAVNASGDYSVALGYNTTAGPYSLAMGSYSNATYSYNLAFGDHALASNNSAIAMGGNARSTGWYSVAIGQNAQALDYGSLALGRDSHALEDDAVAIGFGSYARGKAAFSAGYSSDADGNYSVAIGYNTEANANRSTAMGYFGKTDAPYSFAWGGDSCTSASGSCDVDESGVFAVFGGLCVSQAGGICPDVADGTIQADGAITPNAFDLAERVWSTDELEAGDVVIIDKDAEDRFMRSASAYDGAVAGIVSTEPGVILGWEEKGDTMLALAGRVPVKVTDENGPVHPGDLLTTSSTPGHAMRWSLLDVDEASDFDELKSIIAENERRRNAILGKALEPHSEGEGKIMALVTLQ